MEFSLAVTGQFSGLTAAQQQARILAAGQEAFSEYGIRLTQEDAQMIADAGKAARDAQQLVLTGPDIAPKLIHWFLPSGYLAGAHFAADTAALVTAFYRLRGELQSICDSAGNPDCMLSDNAILDYMYQFYTSPQCGGDPELMLAEAERLLVPAMHRLLAQRADEKKRRSASAGGDAVTRALYADLIAAEEAESALEQEQEAEEYDCAYRGGMRRDVFGNYEHDYEFDYAEHSRGTFAEELAVMLRKNPEFLLPSASQEAEWDALTEQWEEADSAGEGAAS